VTGEFCDHGLVQASLLRGQPHVQHPHRGRQLHYPPRILLQPQPSLPTLPAPPVSQGSSDHH
jgi:hypothetical protein